MRKVLFINPSWEQQPLIHHLRSNFKCLVFGVFSPGSKVFNSIYLDEIEFIDFFDIQTLFSYCILNSIDAVIADQCDHSLFAQSFISSRFQLPGPSTKSAYLSNNKYLQRLRSSDQSILIPKYNLCCTIDEVISFVDLVGFPIILKPVDNRGSIGVEKVCSFAQLNNAYYKSVSCSRSQLILAEEFIDGVQFTCDGYCYPGNNIKTLAIGEKLMHSSDLQVAMGISYPASLSPDLYASLSILNEDVNSKLGYSFGMTHSEYILRNDLFYLVESSNRGGGCFTSELVVPTVSGVDLLDQYCRDCLGLPALASKFPTSILRHNVALRFFSLPSGVYRGILNWNDVVKKKEFLSGRINIDVGSVVATITSDANRHGFIIVDGSNDDANNIISNLVYFYD